MREILAEYGVPFSYRPQVAAAVDYDSSVRHLFATLRDWSGAWPVVVAGGRRYAPSGPRVRASPCSAILSGLG